MNPGVDEYLHRAKRWRQEMEQLRVILLDQDFTEEVKWRQPCYVFNDRNVVIISSFKDYCALNFFKGALIKDEANLLVKAGENTQAGRQMRFTGVPEILELELIIRQYLQQAIEIDRAGLQAGRKSPPEQNLVKELEAKLAEDAAFKAAFEALTPGRQRGYNPHFSGAKQSVTRIKRIEKCVPRILEGYGINDCTCGLSARMPGCDGSHKSIGQTRS